MRDEVPHLTNAALGQGVLDKKKEKEISYDRHIKEEGRSSSSSPPEKSRQTRERSLALRREGPVMQEQDGLFLTDRRPGKRWTLLTRKGRKEIRKRGKRIEQP